jgi:hypothetical protein
MSKDVLDLMAEWKNNHYIVVDELLLDTPVAPAVLIILTDLTYWNKHSDELVQWCDDHGCETSGLSVTLPGPAELTAFNLRWA